MNTLSETIYEIREYTLFDASMMPAWLKLMEEEILPYQYSQGMMPVACFIDRDDPKKYIWIRVFANEAEKKTIYKNTYENPQWTEVIKPKAEKLLDQTTIKVHNVHPVTRSLLR